MYLVSRTETFAKLFFLLSFAGLLMYVALAVYSFRTSPIVISKYQRTKMAMLKIKTIPPRFSNDIKYILLWTKQSLPDGQTVFINNNCSFVNCYLTSNKSLLNDDVSNFNSIVFTRSVNTLKSWIENVPRKRSPKQKYVFRSMVCDTKYPICTASVDGFFNWTWSYKLSSDIVTPFIEVKDLKGIVVAPILRTSWNDSVDDTESINATFGTEPKLPLKVSIKTTKTKALMLYITKCEINKKVLILEYIRQLKEALAKYSLDFDVFGCDFQKCPKGGCLKALERDYYFFLVIEEVFSLDYVSTEVLKAYHHNAVPIVIGGVNYQRYLPLNSFVAISQSEADHLAATLHYVISSPTTYASYFSWKNHFTIDAVNPQRGFCDLCALLNDRRHVEEKSAYESFRSWWYPVGSLNYRCLPKGTPPLEDVLSYLNTSSSKKH